MTESIDLEFCPAQQRFNNLPTARDAEPDDCRSPISTVGWGVVVPRPGCSSRGELWCHQPNFGHRTGLCSPCQIHRRYCRW